LPQQLGKQIIDHVPLCCFCIHSSVCQRLEREWIFFIRRQENPFRFNLLLARLLHFLLKIEASNCYPNMAARVIIFRANAVIAASAAPNAPPTIYIDV
jgi:hypothetical protein